MKSIMIRLYILCTTAMLCVLASGCGLTRSASSRYVSPPVDLKHRQARAGLDNMLQDPAVMLAQSQEYYIGAGDVLEITLVGRQDIFGTTEEGGESTLEFQVTQSPLIALPLIGAIRIHGKTADQLRAELEEAYSQFIVAPIPIVTITNFHHNQVAVLGSVKAPGRFPLEFGDTVLDALYKAGGLNLGRETPPARTMKIYREKLDRKERADLPLEELLERIMDEGTIQPREEIVIPIEDLILGGNLDYNIPLRPNDILYIPAAGTVMIQGKVQAPGVVFLGPSLRTVTQVITERGGLQYSAASTIEVVRTDTNGGQVSYFLDARDMMSRKSEDFLLQDNDQIFVYRHPVRSALQWFGNIFKASASTGINATYNPL